MNMSNDNPTVSIVIVCMNNLKNLYPCLNSIKKYTHVSYECFVVAYLFSKENLEQVKHNFPWVKFIESNEIRGFSENNNLALRQAKGKYCFVLNDDTYHSEPVIDRLVKEFEIQDKEVAIISPTALNKDGSVQSCGRPKMTLLTYTLNFFGLKALHKYSDKKYINKPGLFQTYNILGACFMIRRDVFEHVGWFDERYFFCPEDIALSTLLNNMGYRCLVLSVAKLTHTGGATWSKTIRATKPASVKGDQIFYGNDSFIRLAWFNFLASLFYLFRYVAWAISNLLKPDEHKRTMKIANRNGLVAIFSNKTAKELFTKFYREMRAEASFSSSCSTSRIQK